MELQTIINNVFSLSFVNTVIVLATPLLLASIASYTSAITGVSNIAIESIMTLSALFGVIGSYLTQSGIGGLFIGILFGLLMACIIALFTMRLGANPILVGVALNTFASSLAIFILYQFTGSKGSSASLKTPGLGKVDIPIIKDIPIIGQILSGKEVLVYVCWLLIILLYIFIFKTPTGMRMRACGLNADAAKSAGINVNKLRFFSLILSCSFAAIGGIFISLNYISLFSSGMISGRGWMGIAANGIANGSFSLLIIAAMAFGLFQSLSVIFIGTAFPSELIGALPYILVFVGIAVMSIVNYYRVKRGNVAEE